MVNHGLMGPISSSIKENDMSEQTTKRFGINQKIGSVGFSFGALLSTVFVFTGQVTGEQWLDFMVVYAPAAVGTLTGLSAGIKIAGILKNGKKP